MKELKIPAAGNRNNNNVNNIGTNGYVWSASYNNNNNANYLNFNSNEVNMNNNNRNNGYAVRLAQDFIQFIMYNLVPQITQISTNLFICVDL